MAWGPPGGNRKSKGVPLGARMRNRKLEFPALFSGVLTGSDLTPKRLVFFFSFFSHFIYVTKKGPDAVLPIFHCDVVKFATSHNNLNKHLLTGQMHINEPIK